MSAAKVAVVRARFTATATRVNLFKVGLGDEGAIEVAKLLASHKHVKEL